MKNFTQKFIGLLVFVLTINNAFAQCGSTSYIAFSLSLMDSYGDGWNGSTLSISDCDGIILESGLSMSGFLEVVDVCLPISDYTIVAGGGAYDNEISWTLSDENGSIYLEGGSGTVSNCEYLGCTDSTAFNYNEDANVDDDSCVSQADVDAAYADGAASVTPEDGIGQADVDAAYAEGAASVTPEDGVSQADVDAAAEQAYAVGVASVEIPECEEVSTQNIPLALPQGWSMFGYTCIDSVDAMVGFSDISDKIEIVKDEWGLAYLPAWGFSAFDNLEFGEGYQIKMIENVTGFEFCGTNWLEDGVSQADLDAAVEQVEISYADHTPPLDLQIGDQHAGGIVFQINENGSGLVAAMEDLDVPCEWPLFCDDGLYEWSVAVSKASNYTSGGYSGWHLPSLDELELMYSTIGPGADNAGGFANEYYWCSSVLSSYDAWSVNFWSSLADAISISSLSYEPPTYRVGVIRAF